ncbi:hypothetical protein GUJ93_ZPchr0001g32509 [Zizania palustris]|uniref:Uncharacterized protein n=1 Tax=Zizania palustris TaxID=103762 RepID=A0A8J5RS21_ZIZPA|nr:hypothetical protein GUJ93_ZPchr0001g32509 [Zizania palustris]
MVVISTPPHCHPYASPPPPPAATSVAMAATSPLPPPCLLAATSLPHPHHCHLRVDYHHPLATNTPPPRHNLHIDGSHPATTPPDATTPPPPQWPPQLSASRAALSLTPMPPLVTGGREVVAVVVG